MKETRTPITIQQAVMTFMILVAALNTISIRFNSVVTGSDVISETVSYGSKALMVIVLPVSLLFMKFTPMKLNLEVCRFRFRETKPALKISAIISVIIILAMEIFRFLMQSRNPAFEEIPYFGLYLNMNMRWFYPLNIVIQEIFIKAFVQDNISAAFERKHPLLSALTTALFFMCLHVQYPFYYMCGAFVLCFVTGLIYEKWPGIWGPVLVHFTLGFLPRCLGVMQIIDILRRKPL